MITKSFVLSTSECSRRGWLKRHRPELAAPLTDGEKDRMELGSRLGRMAQTLYPGGINAWRSGLMDDEQADLTARLIDEWASILYEAGFLANDVFVRLDILVQCEAGWEIIEVKSSGSIKDHHLMDLAVQVCVAQDAGLNVTEASLMHVDRSHRPGIPPDPSKLFACQPVLSQLKLDKARSLIEAAKQIAEAKDMPDVPMFSGCWDCPFFEFCKELAPAQPLFHLPKIRRDKIVRFYHEGIKSLDQLPESFPMDPEQKRAFTVLTTGNISVDLSAISLLEKLPQPIFFVDFETTSPALPLVPDARPYELIPFQWHGIMWRNGEETAVEPYLWEGGGDPRPDFIATLTPHLEEAATVLYWSNYEAFTLGELAKAKTKGADISLDLLKKKGHDLMKTAAKAYSHPDLLGRTSIKRFLPALAPGFDYSDLKIKNGDAAVAAHRRLIDPHAMPEAKDKIRADLKDYCQRDVEAMTSVFRALLALRTGTHGN